MQLKSYFSGTVEAAMELARKELGEDALLVNARPAAPETRYLGTYEVVFGVIGGARPPFASEPSGKPAAPAPPAGLNRRARAGHARSRAREPGPGLEGDSITRDDRGGEDKHRRTASMVGDQPFASGRAHPYQRAFAERCTKIQ